MNKVIGIAVTVIAALSVAMTVKTIQQRDTLVETIGNIESKATPVNLTSKLKAPKRIKSFEPALENVVWIDSPISDNAAGIAEAIKKASDSSEAYVLIDSPGGSVFDGNLIVSAIQGAKHPVHTVCLRMCASMAAIIHQHGNKRLMVDRAVLMFHNASGGVQGEVPQMLTRLNFVNNLLSKSDAFIANRAGITADQFRQMYAREFWIDAEDATTRGFNDAIVNLKLPPRPVLFVLPPGPNEKKVFVPNKIELVL